MVESYQVFARRFRPQLFSEVIGQDAIVLTMKNALRSERLAHAYLFSGSRGTGKTSLARLFAKAMNCPQFKERGEPCNTCASCREITEGRSLDVIEIDGASHRGIDDIRAISESVSYTPSCGFYKIYLIDEVHMLTKEAFNALLKTLEEPPEKVKFFFATTEPHKVPSTIISRCQRFNLKRLSPQSIGKKLQLIADHTGIHVDLKAIERIARYAEGGLRDAESLFDQVAAFSETRIDEETVQDVLGLSPQEWFLELDRAIETVDYSVAFSLSEKLFMEGKDIGYFIHDLSEHYKTALFAKLGNTQLPPAASLPFLTVEECIQILDLTAKAYIAMKSSTSSSRIILEWVLIGIIQTRLKVPLPSVVKKLIDFEREFLSQPQPSHTIPSGEIAHQKPLSVENVPPSERNREEMRLMEEAELKKKTVIPPPVPIPAIKNETAGIEKSAKEPIAALRQQKESTTSSLQGAKELKNDLESHDATKASFDNEEEDITPVDISTLLQGRSSHIATETEEQEKSRQESIMHFAAVELGGTLVKKSNRT